MTQARCGEYAGC